MVLWKVLGNGSFELNKDKLRKRRDYTAHLPVFSLQERSSHVVALRKPDSEENNAELKAKRKASWKKEAEEREKIQKLRSD